MSIPFHLPAFNRSTKCCLRRRDMEMLPPEGWAIAFFCLRRNTALKCCSARCPHPAATLQGEFTTARLKFFPVAYRFRAQTYISTHCATHILIKTSTQRIQWQVHGRSGKHRQARFDAAEKRHVGLYRHIRHTHDIACVRLFWSHLQPLNNCDMQYSVRASPPKHPPNTNTLCLG